jgi:hypothetical protein
MRLEDSLRIKNIKNKSLDKNKSQASDPNPKCRKRNFLKRQAVNPAQFHQPQIETSTFVGQIPTQFPPLHPVIELHWIERASQPPPK